MNITIEQAADIVSKTTDELMFLVQNKKIEAGVSESLTWQFDLNDVIKMKEELESELASEG